MSKAVESVVRARKAAQEVSIGGTSMKSHVRSKGHRELKLKMPAPLKREILTIIERDRLKGPAEFLARALEAYKLLFEPMEEVKLQE